MRILLRAALRREYQNNDFLEFLCNHQIILELH